MSSFQQVAYKRSEASAQASDSFSSPELLSFATAPDSQYGRMVVPELLKCFTSDSSRGNVFCAASFYTRGESRRESCCTYVVSGLMAGDRYLRRG